MVDETRATYDVIAGAFADRWFDVRWSEEMAWLIGCLESGARVLDVGCGPGRDTAWLAELGYDAVGIDLSWGMLCEGRARGVTAPLIHGDMAHLPFRSGSFHGLWISASFLHIPAGQAGAVLRELERIVHPGHVCIQVKCAEGEVWEVDEQGHRRFFKYYRHGELESLLEQTGFEVLRSCERPDQRGRPYSWISVLARSWSEASG